MGSRRLALAALATFGLGLGAGAADGARTAYGFAPVLGGLTSPVYVTSAPGDATTLYVVEQPGDVKIVKGGKVAGTFLDIRSLVRSGGEQGLLGLAFHPGFSQNGLFYVSYTDTDGNSRVAEYRTANGVAVTSSARQLLFVKQPYPNHNGGNLQFDRNGYLYLGLGDGGSGGDPENRAQNLKTRLGKLLRTNPLRHGSGWQIVGYGLRNPWRYSFDRATGNLWIGDVGQDSWEEIDERNAASIGTLANFGWSRYEAKSVYDSAKPLLRKGPLVFPVAFYSHADGCSVTGGYVYRGANVAAARGRYFYGDYCSGTVWSFKAGNGRLSPVRVETSKIAALSSFGEDGDGELYATSLNGTLYALR